MLFVRLQFCLLSLTACWSFGTSSTRVIHDSSINVTQWIMLSKDSDDASDSSKQWGRNPPSGNKFLVCNSRTSVPQDNWLISPYIPLPNGVHYLSMEMSASVTRCDYGDPTQSNCEMSLKLWYKTVSGEITIDNSAIASFTMVSTPIAPSQYDSPSVTTLPFDITNTSPGIYIAIQDEGTCANQVVIKLSYPYCPAFSSGLVRFDESLPSSTPVSGYCVPNASHSAPLTRTCDSSGDPSSVTGRCDCDPGYTRSGSSCVVAATSGKTVSTVQVTSGKTVPTVTYDTVKETKNSSSTTRPTVEASTKSSASTNGLSWMWIDIVSVWIVKLYVT